MKSKVYFYVFVQKILVSRLRIYLIHLMITQIFWLYSTLTKCFLAPWKKRRGGLPTHLGWRQQFHLLWGTFRLISAPKIFQFVAHSWQALPTGVARDTAVKVIWQIAVIKVRRGSPGGSMFWAISPARELGVRMWQYTARRRRLLLSGALAVFWNLYLAVGWSGRNRRRVTSRAPLWIESDGSFERNCGGRLRKIHVLVGAASSSSASSSPSNPFSKI